jgi:glucan phosphoethanolaminetransferase (alkaline phosphatase superfamily)
MNRPPSIVQFLLWVSVLGWAIVFGGLLLETAFIVPLWSGALPQSLTTWNINPQHVFDPTKFYWLFTSATVLATIGVWLLGQQLSQPQRKWLAVSSICAATAISYTFIYFLPRNVWLFQRHGSGLSAEQIITLGNHWVVANWVRLIIIGIGFLSALRAFNDASQTNFRS